MWVCPAEGTLHASGVKNDTKYEKRNGGGGEQSRIHSAHEAAAAAAMAALHAKSFGQVGDSLDNKLTAMLQRGLGDTLNRNEVQSSRTCGHLEAEVRTSCPQAPHANLFLLCCEGNVSAK